MQCKDHVIHVILLLARISQLHNHYSGHTWVIKYLSACICFLLPSWVSDALLSVWQLTFFSVFGSKRAMPR